LYLDTSLDENLIMERFSRELVSSIQKLRKDSGLDVVDRIKLTITSNDSFVKESLNIHDDYVKNETLAVELNFIEEETQDLIFDKNVSLDIKKLTNNS
jgi:isoleucyl-tRNA synthetase